MPEQIRFLLATDTHVGYGENKKNIHNDSFTTFEEVLKNAQDQDVDFILLGRGTCGGGPPRVWRQS